MKIRPWAAALAAVLTLAGVGLAAGPAHAYWSPTWNSYQWWWNPSPSPTWGGTPSPTQSPSPTPSTTPTSKSSPSATPTAGTSTSSTSSPSQPGAAPNGPGGSWTLKFADEFPGSSVDTSKWDFRSTAEADWSTNPLGTGNLGNQQLEFDQPANCTVSGGLLKILAKPDSITSSSGKHYNWSSCMLNTSNSYAYRYGYIEMRAQLPALKGFWPALWTWAATGQNLSANGEIDAFEYYSDNHNRLYLTPHTGPGGCVIDPSFDPATGMHTYGLETTSTGTKWWIDGINVCSASAVENGNVNILVDNFVYSGNGDSNLQPAAGTTGTMAVDWVRAWQR